MVSTGDHVTNDHNNLSLVLPSVLKVAATLAALSCCCSSHHNDANDSCITLTCHQLEIK